MTDANMVDFYNRVSRIQRDHSRGYGMEADGTLGRAFHLKYARKRRASRGFLRSAIGPLLMIAVCAFGLKAMLHAKIGEASYNERVAALSQGEGFDKLGATLMTADPITLALSEQLKKLGL